MSGFGTSYGLVYGNNVTEDVGYSNNLVVVCDSGVTLVTVEHLNYPINCDVPPIGSNFTINRLRCLPTQHRNPTGYRVFTVPFALGQPMAPFRNRVTSPSGSIG